MEPIIRIEHLKKEFVGTKQSVEALKDINIEIMPGEIFGIIGLSGAGKSTLVRCINYLEKPTQGKITFDGKELNSLSERELRGVRQQMGMIFQQFQLLEQRNAIRNVTFPLEIQGMKKADAVKRAKELLAIVDLSDRENSFPSQLSGGQKQRVAIARALATNPKVLLCDEATSALDPNTTKSILDLLKKLNRDMGITIVVITHEMEVIQQICESVAIIDEGKIAESGKVADIFMAPKTRIGQKLILGDAMRETKFTEGKYYRITFDGRQSQEPIISNITLAAKAPVNIMYAQTRDVNGVAMGQMVIQLPENEEQQSEIFRYLDISRIKYEEVTDYEH
ncbi:MAG: ATP-binding cassette domain-containing protein [Lachnospiraceae bacterium]|jgi:D-methionine transport system ATP-binding protein|nr:ATP-binding cassette domain-containing protein [Lachnospiraceae bacterium]